ncbi:MAG: serine hydrolase [Betaproteobacteria bacterium]
MLTFNSPVPMDRLDTLCRSLFPADAPGAAIGVLTGDGMRYAKGFGLANLATKTPFTPQTPFRACSISKQFVCLLIRQLEHEGKIELDAHPSRYLPELATFPPRLSVRHLCQNRSGLRDYWCAAMLMGARAESRFTLDDGAALIRSLAEPMFAPGSQYSYSNGNWRILEWIIEAVTGRLLPELLAERIFTRLGMHATGWGCDTGIALAGNIKGYRQTGAGWEEEVTRLCWSGDAALVTTLDDYLAWEAVLLKPDLAVLPCADTLAEALPHPNGEPGCYAFGINAWQQGARTMHWHGGALRGWRMVQMRFPQEQTSIVVMLNRTENPSPFAMKIAECIDIKTTWDDVEESPRPSRHGIAGAYFSADLGLLAEIRDKDDQLLLDLGGEAAPLLWTGERTLANASGFFRLEWREPKVNIRARHFGWQASFLRLAFRDDHALLAGRTFRSDLLKSAITFSDAGTALSIQGPCGQSDHYPVRALAEGFVAFDCDRALDELPPGRFTIQISQDCRRIEVSCFLARGFLFTSR